MLETLAETNPDAVRDLRSDIRAGLGEYLKESTLKEVLCSVLEVDPELVEEARTLMYAENSTARNVGVRVVNEVAGRGYDVDETDPDAVEPATDRFVEWYRSDDHSGYAGDVADLAAEFPEVPTALAEELADRYTDQYSGEYPYDDTNAAIAVAHAAMEVPEQVRSGLAELLDAPDDDQPASLPLVRLGLGDHDAVPEEFAGEDGWLAVQFSSSGERTQLRLIRLIEAVGYGPAEPRLEEVEAEAESDPVAEAAAALERLA